MTPHKRDQLSLAAMHYFRHHFQEATDIYKRLLLENRDDAALNVYVAMCYYKLDYYDVSLEILNVYLQQFPNSVAALNLKAANHYRLFNGTSAETELKSLVEQGVSINVRVWGAGGGGAGPRLTTVHRTTRCYATTLWSSATAMTPSACYRGSLGSFPRRS